MLTYACQCGESYSVGSMSPDPCDGCSKCGTRMELRGPPFRAPEPHRWVTRFDEITGERYEKCDRCNVRKPVGALGAEKGEG